MSRFPNTATRTIVSSVVSANTERWLIRELFGMSVVGEIALL
jgi:hypothetical protein